MGPFPSSYALTLPHLKYDLPENLGKPTVQLQKTTSIAVTQNIFHSSPVRPLPDGFIVLSSLKVLLYFPFPPFQHLQLVTTYQSTHTSFLFFFLGLLHQIHQHLREQLRMRNRQARELQRMPDLKSVKRFPQCN